MNKNYINNQKFEELILSSIEDKKITDDLVDMFDLLISNILFSFKFNIDIDDAKQDCFLLIIKCLNNFTSDKGKAFNYFTTLIINQCKCLYSKEKRYSEKINNFINQFPNNDIDEADNLPS